MVKPKSVLIQLLQIWRACSNKVAVKCSGYKTVLSLSPCSNISRWAQIIIAEIRRAILLSP